MSEKSKVPIPIKSRYESWQMRLLERLANTIGNEGTLFHEIASGYKDVNHEFDALRAEIAHLKSLLFYSRHAVDHISCLEPPYDSGDCWRCRIEKALEAK